MGLTHNKPVQTERFLAERGISIRKGSMEYLIGVVLAVVVCVFAMLAGFDRDRVFYPTLLAPIATYYVLFAVMASSTPALIIESLVAGAFLILGWAGFRGASGWLSPGSPDMECLIFFITYSFRIRVFPCGGPVFACHSISSPAASWPCSSSGVADSPWR